MRVEDPMALGGIELTGLRVHGTARLGTRRDGRHRRGGRLIHLRLGPLRYRRRRRLQYPWLRLRGKIPGGLPHLCRSPARKKEQSQCQGGAPVKIASLHFFIMVACIPFVKEDRPDRRQKMGILCPRIAGLAVECTRNDIDLTSPPVILCLIHKRLAQRIAGTCRFSRKGMCIACLFNNSYGRGVS